MRCLTPNLGCGGQWELIRAPVKRKAINPRASVRSGAASLAACHFQGDDIELNAWRCQDDRNGGSATGWRMQYSSCLLTSLSECGRFRRGVPPMRNKAVETGMGRDIWIFRQPWTRAHASCISAITALMHSFPYKVRIPKSCKLPASLYSHSESCIFKKDAPPLGICFAKQAQNTRSCLKHPEA